MYSPKILGKGSAFAAQGEKMRKALTKMDKTSWKH
jgi:hypothetical protein